MKTEKKPSLVLIINPLQLQAAKILSGVNKQKLEIRNCLIVNSSVLKWSLIEGEEGPAEA